MILIIIIISLVKYYYRILQTRHARMHARTHTRTHAHTRSRTHQPTTIVILVVAVRWVGAPNHDEVNAPFSPPLNDR